MGSETSGSGRSRFSRLSWADVISAMVATAAIYLGVIGVGAHESRPWVTVPFWGLAFSAGLTALCGRLARPSRFGAPLPGTLMILALGTFGLAWSALATPASLDRWSYSIRLLSLASAYALGLAGLHLGRCGLESGVVTMFALAMLGLLEAVLVLVQGPGGSGTYANHAHLAGLLEVLLPLAMAIWMDPRGGPFKRALGGAAFGVGVVAVALSLSRGGWAAAGLAVLATGLAVAWDRRAPAISAALLALLVLALGWTLVAGEAVLDRRLATLRPERLSSDQWKRTRLWNASLRLWRESPVYGVGLGNFRRAFPRVREPGIVMAPRNSHNDYLQFLCEAGLAGGVVSVMLPLSLLGILHLRRRSDRRRRRRLYVVAIQAGVLGFAAHSLVDFNAQIPANLGLVCLLGGLGVGVSEDAVGERRKRKRSRSAPGGEPFPWPRGAAALSVICVGGVAVFGARLIWYQELRNRAEVTLASGAVREAVVLARRAAGVGAADPEAFELLARAHLELASALDPEHRPPEMAAARAALRAGQALAPIVPRDLVLAARASSGTTEALALLERANELGPNDPTVLFALAAARSAAGSTAEAEEALREGLAAFPPGQRPLQVIAGLAGKARSLGWIVRAIPEDFTEAMALLAGRCEANGEVEVAAALWARACLGAPTEISLRKGRGLFLARQGRFAEALGDLEFVRKAQAAPEKALELVTYDCLSRTAQLERADAVLDKALERWPEEVGFWKAKVERLRGEPAAEALKDTLEMVSKRFKRSPIGPLGLGDLLAARGRQDADRSVLRKAAESYREALRRTPGLAAARDRLADVYLDLGDRDRALALITRGGSQEGMSARQLALLAEHHLQGGRFPDALRILRAAAQAEIQGGVEAQAMVDAWVRAIVGQAVRLAQVGS